jgi:hypothetical protein
MGEAERVAVVEVVDEVVVGNTGFVVGGADVTGGAVVKGATVVPVA